MKLNGTYDHHNGVTEWERLSDIDRGAAEAWLKALEEGYENTGVL